MKKNWVMISIIFTFSLSLSNEYPTFTIHKQTKNIYHRFYLVHRLKHTVNSLVIKQNISKNICCKKFFENQFTHPSIKKVVHNLIQQKDLSALVKCWKQFCSYRFIEDKKFEYEFAQLILMICHTINPNAIECKKIQAGNFINSQISTDMIANTFYIIQRLKKPIETICTTCKQSKLSLDAPSLAKSMNTIVFDESRPFTHERIKSCIEEIYHSQNLEPIKKTYKEFTQYRYTGDDIFLKEQLSLLFFAYKVILNKKMSNHAEQIIMHEMESIQYISQNIDDFSIDYILTAIDIMTDKLCTIHTLEKHEENKIQKKMYSLGISLVAIASLPLLYSFMKN